MSALIEHTDSKGKTIDKVFTVEGYETEWLAFQFTDGTHLVAQGSGNYAGGTISLDTDWKYNFYEGGEANELLVALGIRTQAELDTFNEEKRLERELRESKRKLSEQEMAERFPTLVQKGII